MKHQKEKFHYRFLKTMNRRNPKRQLTINNNNKEKEDEEVGNWHGGVCNWLVES